MYDPLPDSTCEGFLPTPVHSSSGLCPNVTFPRPQGGLSPVLMFASTSVHPLSNTHTSVYRIQSQPGPLNQELQEASPRPRTCRPGRASAHEQFPMNQHWLLQNMVFLLSLRKNQVLAHLHVYIYLFFFIPETIFLNSCVKISLSSTDG